MSKANMLIETKDENDGRKTNISLSPHGKEVVKGLEHQHQDVTLAMQKMLGGMSHNLWLALDEFEDLLDEKSTYPRVVEEQRQRESNHIKIVEFEDKYTEDFKALNKWWIDEYFTMEQKDEYILSNPKETIINKGGVILMALYDEIPVGACGLLKLENQKQDYELSKMGIAKEFNRRGIGKILCQAMIDKAKSIGAKSLLIETNSVLTPAISLYKKLGFKQIFTHSSTYGRSDYHLELVINSNLYKGK
jgi:ribosomal protein S18 acetylase RimI-like enzyme